MIGAAQRGDDADAQAVLAALDAAVRGSPAARSDAQGSNGVGSTGGQSAIAIASDDAPTEDVPAGAGIAHDAPASADQAGAAAPSAVEEYVSEPLVFRADEVEHLQGFLEESVEHLDAIEGALLEVEQNPTDASKINELFRPFHTIKGIAGFLNLRDINRLTHEIETILDLARKSEMALTARTIELIFSAIDILTVQVAAIREYLAAPSGDLIPQPDIGDIM